MTSVASAWRRAGLVLAVVLLVDQVTKRLVEANVTVGDQDPILPALKLVHVKNRGVAFSVLEGQTVLVSIVIGVAVLGLVVYFARNAQRPGMWLPVGLLAGGALGNVIDRIRAGAVTDFLKLPSWPAFNVADIAITFGVLGLIYVVEKAERRDAAARPA